MIRTGHLKKNRISTIRHRREDLLILRDILTSRDDEWNGQLDIKRFEDHYCTQSIMDDIVSDMEIEKLLQVQKVSNQFKGIENPIRISGTNTWEKIASIIPPRLCTDIRDSIIVALGHIVANDVKHDIVNAILPIGLNLFSASILKINRIVKMTGQKVDWLFEIWKFQVDNTKRMILRQIGKLLTNSTTVEELRAEIDRGYRILYELTPLDVMLNEMIPSLIEATTELQDRSTLNEQVLQRLRRIIAGERVRLQTRNAWPQVSLRIDTLVRREHRPLINAYRKKINVLKIPQIYRVFEALSEHARPGKPTIKQIIEILDYPRPSAVRIIDNMLPFIVERYVPALTRIGLKYRYLISPKRGQALPKNAILTSMLMKEDLRSVTVHIEPREVDGPGRVPEGTRQLTVDIEKISMRIDLFDLSTGEWSTPWMRKKSSRPKTVAITKTERALTPESLPPRVVELLSVLWGSHTGKKMRGRLLRYMGLQRTMTSYTNRLIDSGVLKFLYHPSLELIGLPDTIFIGGSGIKGSNLRSTMDWLTLVFPYARVAISDTRRRERGDLVAEVRVPQYTEAIVKGIITERLRDISEEYIVDGIAQHTSYYLTSLIRAFDFKNNIWRDPW